MFLSSFPTSSDRNIYPFQPSSHHNPHALPALPPPPKKKAICDDSPGEFKTSSGARSSGRSSGGKGGELGARSSGGKGGIASSGGKSGGATSGARRSFFKRKKSSPAATPGMGKIDQYYLRNKKVSTCSISSFIDIKMSTNQLQIHEYLILAPFD